MRLRSSCFALLWLLDGACGNADPPCPRDSPGTQQPYCLVSIALATRSASSLFVTQDEVDAAYELLRPAWLEEPMLRTARVSYEGEGPLRFDILSSYPPIEAAWPNGEIRTGDATVDALFADQGADDAVLQVSGAEPWQYSITYPHATSLRVLQQRLQAIPSTSLEPDVPFPSTPPDILVSNDGGSTTVIFEIGWGDCASGCLYVHTWQMIVAADGSHQLTDVGGDAVPAAMAEAAAAMPPPL